MSYKPKGMHAAETGEASAVKVKLPTVRTILRKGRPIYSPMLDSWPMIPPTKALVMPDSQESPTVPKISRKLRVSPLTKIAQQLPAKLPALTFDPKTRCRL